EAAVIMIPAGIRRILSICPTAEINTLQVLLLALQPRIIPRIVCHALTLSLKGSRSGVEHTAPQAPLDCRRWRVGRSSRPLPQGCPGRASLTAPTPRSPQATTRDPPSLPPPLASRAASQVFKLRHYPATIPLDTYPEVLYLGVHVPATGQDAQGDAEATRMGATGLGEEGGRVGGLSRPAGTLAP